MNAELKKLEKEKNLAVSQSKWKEAAELCNYIGSELCRLGQHEEALELHNEELSYNDMIKDRLGAAIANRRLGECYSQMNNFKKALTHIEIFKKIATEIGNVVEEQRAWATLGRTFYLKYLFDLGSSDLDKAEISYQKALELAETLKCQLSDKEFAEMKARCLLNLGLVYECRDDIPKCSKCIKNAIFLAHKFGLHEDLNRCQSSLAAVFQKHGQYALSLQLLDGAIESAEKLKDKTLLCDELSTKATIMLCLKDFDGAKHCLKKAYKLKSPLKEDRERVARALKICVGLCMSQNKLQSTDISDSHERKVILEKIADGLSSLECYKLAIEYYFSTLKCMEEGGFTISKRAPIYFSIAMTYKDMGDSEKALKYLNEELMCNENEPKEQIKTLWKIAEILEEVKNLPEAEKIHLKTVSLSGDINNKKLQFKALTKLACFYEQNDMEQKAEGINKKLKSRSFEDFSSDESDTEEESQDPFKDIHLSDLSDTENKPVNGESTSSNRPKRQPKKPEVKRNAKGETPLHKACIDGKFNEVRKLVECGHALNVADFGGWMPLHEASNHGHYDIVEYLLDKGASINERGGSGITALHDAAFNGNLDVVQLLISRGASVTILDDDGNTPLRALLMWKKRTDLDTDTLRLCNKIEEQLKARMLQAGQPAAEVEVDEIPENFFDDDKDEEPICRISPVRIAEKRSRPASFSSEEEYSDGIEDSESPQLLIQADIRDWDAATSAQSEYQSVMSNLRRSAQSVASQPKIVPKKVGKKSGLVDEEEVINDWLVWDTKAEVRSQRKKRKVPRLNVRTSKSLYTYLEPKDNSNLSPSEDKDVSVIEESSNDDPWPVNGYHQMQNLEIRDSPTDSLSTSNRPNNVQQNQPTKLPFWLKVWIGEKCIHVPVPEDNLSIEWLAEEAANRYQSEHLSRPHLTSLMKIDGGILLNTDIIKSSLIHNEELKSTVIKWDEPSLVERYIHLCKRQKLEPLAAIQDQLSKFNMSCEINISNCAVDVQHINLIFESLTYFKNVLHLYFNGTMIVSSNIPSIISCLPSFVSLITLNLTSCALFTDTLQQISHYLDHQTFPESKLPRLKTFLLDYNLFCEPCSQFLTSIIQIPSLTTLGLSNCDLHATTFEDLDLCRTMEHCANLQVFNISGNTLTDKSMDNFLNYLPKQNLVKLDLAYTAGQCQNFLKYFKTCITSEFPQLTDLSLERCNLTDEELLLLTPFQFMNSPNLKSIDLSSNPKLSAEAVIHFVKIASKENRALNVHLTGTCEWDIRSIFNFVDKIDYRCLNSVTLDNISEVGREELFEWWKRCWNDKAKCVDSIFCKISLI
ncbi:hypothetical protein JTE90_011885 [Oedothorax gibbosus]|uniref:Tonsoku-like protein n=1 Tax=Oedothorax gibbosus TaxID=931172 RepID=A0AAV6V356_9ARAC|nr:hypothetical protein JTE90_011885 [Oedothorax gibbosus]